MPGNHDHAGRMLRALAGTGWVRAAGDEPDRCYYRVDHPGLRLLCCDSSAPGRPLAFVDEPAGLLLHRLEGGAAMTHLVPISHSGPPIGVL